MPPVEEHIKTPASCLLIVSVKDMAEFERFARRFLTDNPHVKRYFTNIVISEVKTWIAIP